ncbi:tail fiber assembly protein [Pantoea agglomerans]|nr:tail fiber assembly protein [Pantoea agglomerans]
MLKAIKRMAVATDEANRTTTPLLDAVDISIAADDELARLAELNLHCSGFFITHQ